jgi:hypothetical protein
MYSVRIVNQIGCCHRNRYAIQGIARSQELLPMKSQKYSAIEVQKRFSTKHLHSLPHQVLVLEPITAPCLGAGISAFKEEQWILKLA